MDQYTRCDERFDPYFKLHTDLFTGCGENHRGNLHYAVCCRATLGHTLHTRDGRTSVAGGPLFATPARRELVNIPPSVNFNQPVPHHSLV